MSNLPVIPIDALALLDRMGTAPVQNPQGPASIPFSQVLSNGLDRVNNDVLEANRMVRSFVLDDSVPVHQVTYALEQARLSLELAMQVRNRLVESYQQLMNMQL